MPEPEFEAVTGTQGYEGSRFQASFWPTGETQIQDLDHVLYSAAGMPIPETLHIVIDRLISLNPVHRKCSI